MVDLIKRLILLIVVIPAILAQLGLVVWVFIATIQLNLFVALVALGLTIAFFVVSGMLVGVVMHVLDIRLEEEGEQS